MLRQFLIIGSAHSSRAGTFAASAGPTVRSILAYSGNIAMS